MNGRFFLVMESCHGVTVFPHFSFSGDRHAREALSPVAELFASSDGTCSVKVHERGQESSCIEFGVGVCTCVC